MAEPTDKYPIYCEYEHCEARWSEGWLSTRHSGSLFKLGDAHRRAIQNPIFGTHHPHTLKLHVVRRAKA